MSLIVICPSRGRPDKAKEAFQAFEDTKTLDDTEMIFVVDFDDPKRNGYVELPFCMPDHEVGVGMGPALNAAALDLLDYDYLGFIGDDHRFRTKGWDAQIARTLKKNGGGFAYGNDLIQGINLPTQIFMDSVIVRTLGWMALPGAKHLFFDNTWKMLGERLDRLFYFPEVVIEHMHPTAGKAEWDEHYRRVNAPEVYGKDGEAYASYLVTNLEDDVERLRAALQ